MQYPMPVDMAGDQITKKRARIVRRRDGMKYRHSNNIDKKLQTRLEGRWTRSKQAEIGGWVSAAKGKERVTSCLVPESQLRPKIRGSRTF